MMGWVTRAQRCHMLSYVMSCLSLTIAHLIHMVLLWTPSFTLVVAAHARSPTLVLTPTMPALVRSGYQTETKQVSLLIVSVGWLLTSMGSTAWRQPMPKWTSFSRTMGQTDLPSQCDLPWCSVTRCLSFCTNDRPRSGYLLYYLRDYINCHSASDVTPVHQLESPAPCRHPQHHLQESK